MTGISLVENLYSVASEQIQDTFQHNATASSMLNAATGPPLNVARGEKFVNNLNLTLFTGNLAALTTYIENVILADLSAAGVDVNDITIASLNLLYSTTTSQVGSIFYFQDVEPGAININFSAGQYFTQIIYNLSLFIAQQIETYGFTSSTVIFGTGVTPDLVLTSADQYIATVAITSVVGPLHVNSGKLVTSIYGLNSVGSGLEPSGNVIYSPSVDLQPSIINATRITNALIRGAFVPLYRLGYAIFSSAMRIEFSASWGFIRTIGRLQSLAMGTRYVEPSIPPPQPIVVPPGYEEWEEQFEANPPGIDILQADIGSFDPNIIPIE